MSGRLRKGRAGGIARGHRRPGGDGCRCSGGRGHRHPVACPARRSLASFRKAPEAGMTPRPGRSRTRGVSPAVARTVLVAWRGVPGTSSTVRAGAYGGCGPGPWGNGGLGPQIRGGNAEWRGHIPTWRETDSTAARPALAAASAIAARHAASTRSSTATRRSRGDDGVRAGPATGSTLRSFRSRTPASFRSPGAAT